MYIIVLYCIFSHFAKLQGINKLTLEMFNLYEVRYVFHLITLVSLYETRYLVTWFMEWAKIPLLYSIYNTPNLFLIPVNGFIWNRNGYI